MSGPARTTSSSNPPAFPLDGPGAPIGPALSGGDLPVREPATGQLLATVGLASVADIGAAVEATGRAQPGWATTAPKERAAVLRVAAQVLERRREEVAEWLIREGGAVRGKAEYEVSATLDELWEASALPTRPHGSLLATEQGRQSTGRRTPLGIVGVISPWNVPLLLAMRSVAPALALGNSVVLKPDVHTPISGGHVVARLFEEAGLPDGVLRVLPGDTEPGQALVTHPDVAMIAFTGSTEVGRQVGGLAGQALKRVSLELGGNNALIVLDDADLDAAASAGAFGSFFHQGQICMAAGRHLVHRQVADEYAALLAERAEGLRTGDPFREDVALGPVINRTQQERVDRIIRESVRAGAKLLTGGVHEGPFYAPTVLSDVTSDMPAFTEEIFGPTAPVIAVDDDEEAIRLANSTEYGLTAAIRTGSVQRGLAIADRLRTGIVHVNDQTVNDEAHVPFGGQGASGNGSRHGSEHSWDEFTQWQWLTVRDIPTKHPL